MTRRPFLASLFSLLAAPFVVKKAEAAPAPLPSNEEVMRELSKITSKAQYERMGRHMESIHTGKGNRMWQEWTNDGRMIEHFTEPKAKNDSFVVQVFESWDPIKLP